MLDLSDVVERNKAAREACEGELARLADSLAEAIAASNELGKQLEQLKGEGNKGENQSK